MPEQSVAVRADDGTTLRGDLYLPYAGPPSVVAVVSHAMMANRRSLDRPAGRGLVSSLRAIGIGVLCMDLRGHGDSEPRAGDWTYDDLVADTGDVVRYVAERFPGAQRVAIGHSLFAHTSLAYQATRVSSESLPQNGFHRMVLIGGSVWAKDFEPSRARWLAKSLIARSSHAVMPSRGALPARRLGTGSADESWQFMNQVMGWAIHGYRDLRGASYTAALPNVTVPLLSIAGQGDLLLSAPATQARFVRRTSGPVRHEVIGTSSGDSFNPGHMELVLDERMRPTWERIARFAAYGD